MSRQFCYGATMRSAATFSNSCGPFGAVRLRVG